MSDFFDNRFPWILKPESVSLHSGKSALRGYVREVEGRTNVRVGLDARSGSVVFFVRGDVENMRGLSMPCIRNGSAYPPSVDDTVEIIRLGEIPRWMKMRELERQKKAQLHDATEQREKRMEDTDRETLKKLRYMRERRGMGKRWQKSVTVKESKP